MSGDVLNTRILVFIILQRGLPSLCIFGIGVKLNKPNIFGTTFANIGNHWQVHLEVGAALVLRSEFRILHSPICTTLLG